jgi:guanylate cyclase
MRATLQRSWERISSLGTTGEALGERRRIRITNQSLVIGMVSCGSFAVGYLLAGDRYQAPMLANVLAVACIASGLVLSRARKHRAARIMLLLPVNLVVVVASMLLGGRVGFVYYFFLFAMVAFLVFETDRLLKWTFLLLSVACCIFVRIAAPHDAAALITENVARALDIVSAVSVMATVTFIVYLFAGDTTRAEARLAEEHARSEQLLLNILPAAISARLKETDEPIADGFTEVTVLFADLVGFTDLSQRLSPEEVVRMLNGIFTAFDDLAVEIGVEKIKTLGDGYMVAAGLPERRPDHAETIARMALGMRAALRRVNAASGYALRIRIGIHTGPVVAGVIGKRKFTYDLWGDTVNTASRMESSGVADEIQVTRAVRDRLADRFELEPRGTITVKGKGEMETFLLKSERAT